MSITADLGAYLLPAHADDKINGEMIQQAFNAFQTRYPNAVTVSPTHKFVSKDAQNVTFSARAEDMTEATQMQAFFDQKLYEAGFRPAEAKSKNRTSTQNNGNTFISKLGKLWAKITK